MTYIANTKNMTGKVATFKKNLSFYISPLIHSVYQALITLPG